MSGHKPQNTAPDQALAQALAALAKAGMRETQPRIALLKALIADHGPFTVDELRNQPATQDLDRVTLYRCLTAFEEIGLVRRCEFGDGISRYEYSAGEHHHHHVICKRCRKTQSIDECIPPQLVEAVQKMGYADVTHSLEFFGICKSCAAG